MSMDEPFLAELLQSPEDWTVRGVFADWCEDNDRPAQAACLRWMVRARKRPHRGSAGVGTWFNADGLSPAARDETLSNLPGALYRHLQGGNEVANHRTFATLTEAERAVFDAWLWATEEGWTPEKAGEGA